MAAPNDAVRRPAQFSSSRTTAAFSASPTRNQLVKGATTKDRQAARTSAKQVYRGVPVFGGELKSHFDAPGNLVAVSGTFVPGINVKSTPSRTAAEAATAAVARVQADLTKAAWVKIWAGTPTLTVYREGLAKGVEGANRLAWLVEVGNRVNVREFVFVDAHTGKVIEKFNGIHDAKNRRAFDGQGAVPPYPNYPANPFWVEGQGFPGTTEADNMIEASSEIYDLFKKGFGRDSFDGNGAMMDSIFNRGNGCPNASWNGVYISFCPGTTTDDITAHEWAHAYTEYTHGLIYAWQPGALNEAYSDIWGETVDRINTRGAVPLMRPHGRFLHGLQHGPAHRHGREPPAIAGPKSAGRRISTVSLQPGGH
jgi:Zn-dependent metalloprotease